MILTTVRYIEFEKVAETVEALCVAAAHELPDDDLAALEKAAQHESNPRAARSDATRTLSSPSRSFCITRLRLPW